MYAGTTIRRGSGKIVGVHQKIDRAARRHIKKYLPKSVNFPSIKDILYFEGDKGPDGLKRKDPASGQTWYFIDPQNPNDRELMTVIHNHIVNLSVALRDDNKVRSSFEAAWLAHAIVDGLTPAHHYPLGEKIEELWGKSFKDRFSIWDKNVIVGDNIKDTISKNWEYWGAGGVFTTHGVFEIGVASAISTDTFRDINIGAGDIVNLKTMGFEATFMKSVNKINNLDMYNNLKRSGWTQKLAKQTRQALVPEIIRVVALAWYQSAIMSLEQKK